MGRVDCHVAWHDQMELHEGHVPGHPRSDVMRFDGSAPVLGYNAPDVGQRLGIGRLVHEPAHGFAQHLSAGPKDVYGDDRRQGRVQTQPSSQGNEGESDENAARCPNIGHDVLAARRQCGRTPSASHADQEQRPKQIDDSGGGIKRDADERGLGSARILPAEIGLSTDGEGRRHHHERLDGGADIFGLLVAVRVVRVGWLLAEPERYQRREGSDDVDRRFQRVGIQRDASGNPIGGEFQTQYYHTDAEAAPCRFHCACHRNEAAPWPVTDPDGPIC